MKPQDRLSSKALTNSSATIVAATSWLSRELHRQYDAEHQLLGERAWASPDIVSLDGWLRRTWQERVFSEPVNTPVLLDSAQEQVLWEDSIRASHADDVLLNIPQTAAAAAAAWDLLHAWEAPLHGRDFDWSADCEAFLGWMRAVQIRLNQNGWITRGELPGVLAKQFAMGGRTARGDVTTVGFDDPPPAVARLCRELGTVSRPDPQIPSRACRVECADMNAELTAAAWWARQRLEASPGLRIGVIVHGLAGVAAVAQRIFDDVLHPSLHFERSAPRAFHIFRGTSSADVPLISSALLMLGLTDALTLPEAGMLLRTPFVRIATGGRIDLDYRLRRQGADRVSIHLDVMRQCFPELAELVRSLPERQRPGQWSSTFSKMVSAGRWLEEKEVLSSIEQRELEHWKNLLSAFARLDLVIPDLTLPQAVERLRRMAAGSPFASIEPDAPVQILDIADSAGARFDALWVAGLHAGAWPASAKPHPFLPLALQRQMRMPHCLPEHEFEFARATTERLRASAPEVIFSSPMNAVDETLRVSPLLENTPKLDDAFLPGQSILQRVFASGVDLEECAWGQASVLPEGTPQSGGTKLLERQAACPFQAFAAFRLGARELGEPPLGISPLERGSVVHKALEHFWNQVKTHAALVQLTDGERAQAVDVSIGHALEEGLGRRKEGTGAMRFRELEEARLSALMEEWLRLERDRKPFIVVQNEHEEPVCSGGLALIIRADRVDRYEATGGHVIIDYKTSANVKESMWQGVRPEAPQLPLYAITSVREVQEIAFAKLVPRATKLILDESAAQNIPAWREALDTLATNYRLGHADADPRTGACKLCHFASLCRIGEIRAEALREEAAE